MIDTGKSLIFHTRNDKTGLVSTDLRGDQDRRHAADLAADIFPAPAVFALDAEQLIGEFGSRPC
jgi:hypothetical protein